MRMLLAFCFCFLVSFAVAQPESKSNSAQLTAFKDEPVPLQWNRYTTNNFEILSLDDAQGKYLFYNIEFIKTWTLWRWGIKDVDFASGTNKQIVKCKVVAVPNRDLYFNLFGKKDPTWRVEIKDGKFESVIWIITDEQKWNTAIPTQLTEVILTNFENTYQTKFPVWCRRGMTVLNSRLSDIKLNLKTEVISKTLLEMTPEVYSQLTSAQKTTYDSQAAVFCLWLRQEHNGKVFLDFLSAAMGSPQSAFQVVGFTSYADADQKLKAYLSKLVNVPDNYLTW